MIYDNIYILISYDHKSLLKPEPLIPPNIYILSLITDIYDDSLLLGIAYEYAFNISSKNTILVSGLFFVVAGIYYKNVKLE